MLERRSALAEMKEILRGKLLEWNCRAGQNTVIVRTDGTLAPCFPLYSATYDWGTIEQPQFDTKQLTDMKQSCQPHCFSTLNHIVAFCYNEGRAIRFLLRQALRGFQGVTSNFDRTRFQEAVRRAIEYVHAGDCFQVNVAQRLLARGLAGSTPGFVPTPRFVLLVIAR